MDNNYQLLIYWFSKTLSKVILKLYVILLNHNSPAENKETNINKFIYYFYKMII